MTSLATLDEAKSGGILSGLTRSPCLGLVVALILAVHSILAVTAVRDKSTTFDELSTPPRAILTGSTTTIELTPPTSIYPSG